MNSLTFSGTKGPTALPEALREVLTIAPSASATASQKLSLSIPPPTRIGTVGHLPRAARSSVSVSGKALAGENKSVGAAEAHGELDILDEPAAGDRRARAIVNIGENRDPVGRESVSRP